MRNLLCLVCVATGAIYTTPRAAKREAVEKAAESARGAEAATADGVEPVLSDQRSPDLLQAAPAEADDSDSPPHDEEQPDVITN